VVSGLSEKRGITIFITLYLKKKHLISKAKEIQTYDKETKEETT